MAPVISYCIIFGILSFTNGNPAYRREVSNPSQYELTKMLEKLYKQNNYDNSHHEDQAQIIYDSKSNNLQGSIANLEKTRQTENKILPGPNSIQSKQLIINKQSSTNIKNEDGGKTNNCQQLRGKCSEINWDDNFSRSKKNYASQDEIFDFLNDLDKYLLDSNYQSRCYGNGCGRNINDYNENKNNRHSYDNGNRHTSNNNNRNENYYRNTGSNYNKNRYNAYSNNRYDKFYNNYKRNTYNNRYKLRCQGNKCGREKSTYYRDNLRCVGYRCGRSRDVPTDIGKLRCIGASCGRIGNSLRCVGDRCGINREERYNLRCFGDRCSRRTDNTDENDNDDRDNFERYDDSNDRNYLYNDRYNTGNDYYNRDDDDRYSNGEDNWYNTEYGNGERDDIDNDYNEIISSLFGDDRYRCVGNNCHKNERDRDRKNERNIKYYTRSENNRDDIDGRDDADDRDDTYSRDDRDNNDENYKDDIYNRDDRESGYDRDDEDSRDEDEDDDEDDIEDKSFDIRDDRDNYENNNRNEFRCNGDRCDRERNNNEGGDSLRSSDDENLRQSTDDLKSLFGISDLNNIVANLKNIDSNLETAKLPASIDLQKLFKDREGLIKEVKTLFG